jgi:hypothetical protein
VDAGILLPGHPPAPWRKGLDTLSPLHSGFEWLSDQEYGGLAAILSKKWKKHFNLLLRLADALRMFE